MFSLELRIPFDGFLKQIRPQKSLSLSSCAKVCSVFKFLFHIQRVWVTECMCVCVCVIPFVFVQYKTDVMGSAMIGRWLL